MNRIFSGLVKLVQHNGKRLLTENLNIELKVDPLEITVMVEDGGVLERLLSPANGATVGPSPKSSEEPTKVGDPGVVGLKIKRRAVK